MVRLRYLCDRPLPAAPYLPGGVVARPPETARVAPLPPERWREDDGYLWGADLYDAGFAWEAHEAWEAVWMGAAGAQRELLQGLIQIAAAAVKLAQRRPEPAARLAARAAARLAGLPRMMGVDAPALARALASGAPPPRLELPVRRVLSSERLHVRRLAREDRDDLVALCGDPEVMAFVGDNKPMPPDKVDAWIERTLWNYDNRPFGFGMWVVHERAGGAFAGYCGILYPEGKPELVYTLHQRCWGRGLGGELAAAVLAHALARVPTVIATVDPANRRSQKILQRIGMVYQRSGLDEAGLPTEWWTITRRGEP